MKERAKKSDQGARPTTASGTKRTPFSHMHRSVTSVDLLSSSVKRLSIQEVNDGSFSRQLNESDRHHKQPQVKKPASDHSTPISSTPDIPASSPVTISTQPNLTPLNTSNGNNINVNINGILKSPNSKV